jgi:hypothetical protein
MKIKVKDINGKTKIFALDGSNNSIVGAAISGVFSEVRELDEALDIDCIKIVDNVIVADTDLVAAKIQNPRTLKLQAFRIARDIRLVECDYIVNDLALGKRDDFAEVGAYRDALFDITDTYKTNGVASASCDALDVDNFGDWPVKPTV